MGEATGVVSEEEEVPEAALAVAAAEAGENNFLDKIFKLDLMLS